MKLPFAIDREGCHLVALPSVLALADIGATLIGQPKGYWRGDYSLAFDANPLVTMALGVTPWLALPAALIWCGMIGLVMLVFPALWRRRAYLLLCVAHLIFVWGWVIRWELGFGLLVAFVAGGIAWIMRRQIIEDRRRERAQ